MKIKDEILEILAKCRTEGNTLYLPEGQLDRKTYEAVNKCLVNIGGKWNRKAKGHVFDHDPADDLDAMLLTGEIVDLKKQFQFFPTPRNIADQMCDLAELDGKSCVLEPSCGKGDLMDAIYDRGVAHLCGVELNSDMKKYLKNKPYITVTGIDFLDFVKEVQGGKIRQEWDRIIMNPPFCKQQDIDHILAAYDVLLPGGILLSVCSPSPFFRTNKKSTDFREWLDDRAAEIIDVPEGAFKDSGTMIRTKIIKIKKAW